MVALIFNYCAAVLYAPASLTAMRAWLSKYMLFFLYFIGFPLFFGGPLIWLFDPILCRVDSFVE
jgi:hypothetical protein